jgi:hypothetical protein
MKKYYYIIVLLAFLTCFFSIIIFTKTERFNNYLKSILCSVLEKKLNRHVTIGKFDYKLFNPKLIFENVAIISNKEKLLIKEIEADFKIFQFFSKKISINKLSVNNLRLEISYTKEKRGGQNFKSTRFSGLPIEINKGDIKNCSFKILYDNDKKFDFSLPSIKIEKEKILLKKDLYKINFENAFLKFAYQEKEFNFQNINSELFLRRDIKIEKLSFYFLDKIQLIKGTVVDFKNFDLLITGELLFGKLASLINLSSKGFLAYSLNLKNKNNNFKGNLTSRIKDFSYKIYKAHELFAQLDFKNKKIKGEITLAQAEGHEFTVYPNIDVNDKLDFRGRIKIKNFLLDDILDTFSVRADNVRVMVKNGEGELTGNLKPFNLKGDLNLKLKNFETNISSKKIKTNELQLKTDFELNTKKITLINTQISHDDSIIDLSAFFDFKDSMAINYKANFTDEDDFFIEEKKLDFSGTIDGEIAGKYKNLKIFSKISLNNINYSNNLNFDYLYGEFLFNNNRFDLNKIKLAKLSSQIKAHGYIETFYNGETSLSIEFSGLNPKTIFSIKNIDGNFASRIDINGKTKNPNINLKLFSDDLKIGKEDARIEIITNGDIYNSSLSAKVFINNAEININGNFSVKNKKANIKLYSLEEFLFKNININLNSIELDLADNEIKARGIIFDALAFDFKTILKGAFPYNFSASGENLLLSKILKNDANFDINFASNINLSGNLKSIKESSGTWNITELYSTRHDINLIATKTNIQISIQKGNIKIPKSVVNTSTASFTISGEVSREGSINGNITGGFNLSFFEGLFREVSSLKGNAKFDLSLKGKINDPKFSGSITIDKMGGYLDQYRLGFDNGHIEAIIFSDKVLFENFEFSVGGGNVYGSGELFYNELDILSCDIGLSIHDVEIMLEPKVTTNIGGNLNITKPKDYFFISGDLNLNNFYHRKRIDYRGDVLTGWKEKEGPVLEGKEKIRFDINITSKRNIIIDNNLLNSELSGNFRLTGSDIKPAMIFDLSIVTGKLFFRANEFKLISGIIKSDGEILSFNISAETEIREYKIFINISGRDNKFFTTFSSQPTLSENDIISLIEVGLLMSEREASSVGTMEAVAFVSGKAQDFVEKQLNKRLKFIKTFQIVPAYSETSKSVEPMLILSADILKFFDLTYRSTLSNLGEQKAELTYTLNKNVLFVTNWKDGGVNKDSELGADVKFRFELK